MTNEEMIRTHDKKINIGAFTAKKLYLGGEGFTHLYMNNNPKISSNITSK